MNVAVLTIFPEMFDPFLTNGMIKRAIDNHKLLASLINIRDFASGRHRVTDDRPYGGGCGMVLKPEPLAGAIRAMGPVDLVICGEGSSDEYAQQINARLAAQLGFASVSCVNQMDAADGTLRLERKLEDGIEKVEVSGPAVISVMPDINDPPIPSLKQILGAKKKPSTARSLDDIDLADADLVAGIEVRSVLSPVVTRGSVRLNEEGVSMADAVGRLVDQLKADNIIT